MENIKSKFNERLKELRIEKGLTQIELSKATGLSQSAIALWECGQRLPNVEVIITIATYFGVTSDYLIGLED